MKAIKLVNAKQEFKLTKEYKKIMGLAGARLISERISDLEKAGYDVKECAMGSGGVGNVKFLNNEIRVQIGYGHGKRNYAMCVILKK